MGRVDGTPKVFGVLDEDERDDDTATTAMLTDLDEMASDSEGDSDDGEDFVVENAPRPPPETPLYGGNGKSNKDKGPPSHECQGYIPRDYQSSSAWKLGPMPACPHTRAGSESNQGSECQGPIPQDNGSSSAWNECQGSIPQD